MGTSICAAEQDIVFLSLLACGHTTTKASPESGGRGVLLGILGGGVPTLFQTKKCHFPYLFSDQTSKIHTRFQTLPLGRNYVIIN